ncbi:putative sinapoylglucose--sinapoylglucose O-sinapoyltransferase [Helianthus debilis subsp. tardiflorus]
MAFSELMFSFLTSNQQFLSEHPKFSHHPLYIAGTSYVGIIVPKGYILCNPLTNKFMDFNSRLEYAYRMALISDDIQKSARDNCHGNYVDINSANSACANSLQRYEEVRIMNTCITTYELGELDIIHARNFKLQCTSHIQTKNILEPFCDENDPTLDCDELKDLFNLVVTRGHLFMDCFHLSTRTCIHLLSSPTDASKMHWSGHKFTYDITFI